MDREKVEVIEKTVRSAPNMMDVYRQIAVSLGDRIAERGGSLTSSSDAWVADAVIVTPDGIEVPFLMAFAVGDSAVDMRNRLSAGGFTNREPPAVPPPAKIN